MKAGIPGLQVFFPFAEHMARPNPNDCPSVTEALAEFKALVSIEHYLLRFGMTRIPFQNVFLASFTVNLPFEVVIGCRAAIPCISVQCFI
jgi:hypothetical protein